MKIVVAVLAVVLVACGGETAVDGGTDAGSRCIGATDGMECGDGQICSSGACVASVCGDSFLDVARGEECDDGNENAFDGCDPPSCTFGCDDESPCGDGDPCNGEETCSASHTCVAGTPLDEGTECATATSNGVCRSGECIAPGCGNGFLDDGEECDDGDLDDGDGCDGDCTYTCDATTSCEDNNVCNGVAICQLADHTCMAGAPPNCDDTNNCTADACDPVSGCLHTLVTDADMDGFAPTSLGACGTDCNDGDASIYPGATELCDTIDQNCDGNPTATTTPTWYEDCDNDDYATAGATSIQQCPEPTGGCGNWTSRVPAAGDIDCNDGNAAVHPRLSEIPGDASSLDEDCDGSALCYTNMDGDAFRGSGTIATVDADCSDAGEAYATAAAGDCDDTSATVYPSAPEIASDTRDADENCDGTVTCLADTDGDGYGIAPPSTSIDADCADAGEARFPALDNCPALASTDQTDADGDGAGDVCDACPDTANPGTACPTIYDLKRGTVVPGVMTGGPRFTFRDLVVTGVAMNGYFVQVPVGHPTYAGADYSGIFVFTGPTPGPVYTDGMRINMGDNLDVSGRFISFNGQLELSPATATRSTASRPIPDPVVAPMTGELVTGGSRALSLEAVLVQIMNVMVTNTNAPTPGEFIVNGNLHVDDYISPTIPLPTIGQFYSSITGILVYRFAHNSLNPRMPGDVEF